MHKPLLIIFLSTLFTHFCAHAATMEMQVHEPSPWKLYSSTYFEAVHLHSAETFAGLVVPKLGVNNPELGIEIYGTARTGVDSRTYLDPSDAIYNDNYLFLGAGIDYVKLLHGVRLSFQLGHSFDLNSKIKRAGFDIRTGFMTYHEIDWVPAIFRNEIYSEGFYVRRYQDVIGSIQARSFLILWRSSPDRYRGFETGPYLNLMASRDTSDFDYNRFLEAQYGARIRYQAPMTLAFHVLGVIGHRTDSNDPHQHYDDFRLLLTGYWEI